MQSTTQNDFRRFVQLHKILFVKKKNTAHAVQAKDFVGVKRRQNDRVCCGAVNLLGIIHGEAVFKMNTTTSCGEIQATQQNRWDLQEKYHCMWNSSREI